MSRRLFLAALLVATLTASSPARAWSPDFDPEPFDRPEPDPTTMPEPQAARPDGIYLVSETYVDDVVSHNGPVTTYSTETVHEITGSYARVLETVPTGASSGYDGSAFNGRAALTDGRAVAGTYYENYVRTDNGFTAVSIVFFQDDLEVARAREAAAQAPQGPALRPIGTVNAPPASAPLAPAVGSVDPRVDDGRLPRDLDPVRRPDPAMAAPLPGLDLEVLRARRAAITLSYPGAIGWRLVSGEGVVLSATSGGAGDRFVARWDRLAPVGGAWVDRFQIAFADGSTRELAVRVIVRAPGLVE